MDVLYVYCFKSVGIYKHKLSRTESLVILYWGINCTGITQEDSSRITERLLSGHKESNQTNKKQTIFGPGPIDYIIKIESGSVVAQTVVRHLPLVLEVPGSIYARGEDNFGVRTRFL